MIGVFRAMAWVLAFIGVPAATILLVGVLPARESRLAESVYAAPVEAPKPAEAAAAAPRPEPVVAAPEVVPAAVPAEPAPPAGDEPFVIRRILDIGGPIKFGDYYWDDNGVPDGPVVITVDIEAQTLSVFRAGYEIGATAILYGDDEKPTPLGTFPITQKKKDHISNLYNAPMPYMQRLTNDGVAIHGSEVEWGYATHGCVGVPVEFAEKLFGVTKLGDKVIITEGKRIGMGDRIIA